MHETETPNTSKAIKQSCSPNPYKDMSRTDYA